MGINASPTCVMAYDDAVGYLIGEPNQGMRYMFTMMNTARLSVGLEGVAVGDRAYQQAVAYAAERRQGRAPGRGGRVGDRRARRRAPDAADDEGPPRGAARHRLPERRGHRPGQGVARRVGRGRRRRSGSRSSRRSSRAGAPTSASPLTSLAVQVHGGMGYIEETGVAQHYRDIRIAPIYEGTNGIQAMDLVGRKLGLRGGAAFAEFVAGIVATADEADGDRRRRPRRHRRARCATAPGRCARRRRGSAPTSPPTRTTPSPRRRRSSR